MANPRLIKRRDVLGAAGLTLAAAKTGDGGQASGRAVMRGRIRQSVSRWCYSKIPMPEFCRSVSAMGLTAIDFLVLPRVGSLLLMMPLLYIFACVAGLLGGMIAYFRRRGWL